MSTLTSLPDHGFGALENSSSPFPISPSPSTSRFLSHGREVPVLALSAPQNEDRKEGVWWTTTSPPPPTLASPRVSGKQRVHTFLAWHFSMLHPSPAQACCVAFGGPSTGCSVLCSMTVGWYQARCFRKVDPAGLGECSQAQPGCQSWSFNCCAGLSPAPCPSPGYHRVL